MSNILAERIPHNHCFATLIECINEIPDPRSHRRRKHPLSSIIVLTICAILGGANSWFAVEEFGKNHRGWFIRLLDLPHGIPSHDTINRVFYLLDHHALMNWLWLWLEDLIQASDDHISLDGKVQRSLRSIDPMITIRAWADKSRLVLGQVKVPRGTNEITSIPQLLNMLDIKGKTITIDAIGTQKNVAQLIVEKGGNYVLPIKANQHRLFSDMKLFLDDMAKDKFDDVLYTYHQTENRGHGRHEIRRCWTTQDIDWFEEKHLWYNMKSISIIESTRTEKNKTSISRRYFVTDLPSDAQRILSIVRSHWGIENGPHWSLDVVFEEDRSTVRKGKVAICSCSLSPNAAFTRFVSQE